MSFVKYGFPKELFIKKRVNYYHFMTETALGIYNLLKADDLLENRDCTIYYSGYFRDVVQIFTLRPLIPSIIARIIRRNPVWFTGKRLERKEDFYQMLPLRDFLASMIPHVPAKKGITVVKRNFLRRYAEHERLVERLKKFALPVCIVRLEELSFAQQVNIMRNTKILIFPHGAAQVNMMFLSPGTKAIELYPKGYSNWHPSAIAEVFGIDYTAIESERSGRIGRPPTTRIKEYLKKHGWPDRKTVSDWQPDNKEMMRFVRDVASFSIDPERIIQELGH